MARKVPAPGPSASAPSGADADSAAELDVLFPERTIRVGDRDITVHEIGFVDGLRLHRHVAPIVGAIEHAMREQDRSPDYAEIVAVFGEHWESTVELIAASTGEPATWLSSVSGRDGDVLLMTFWAVNASFFIQRAANAAAIRREQARLLDGASSSAPSLPTDTHPSNSDATPSDS